MDYAICICRLTGDFTARYPIAQYPELMGKLERPYSCLLIDTHEGYFICVPFRSNINHGDAYLFKGTKRSQTSRSGLDYTKVALITDPSFFSTQNVIIDADEYAVLRREGSRIAAEVSAYISGYIDHVTGRSPLHHRVFSRHYGYSTLPYFHDILGI